MVYRFLVLAVLALVFSPSTAAGRACPDMNACKALSNEVVPTMKNYRGCCMTSLTIDEDIAGGDGPGGGGGGSFGGGFGDDDDDCGFSESRVEKVLELCELKEPELPGGGGQGGGGGNDNECETAKDCCRLGPPDQGYHYQCMPDPWGPASGKKECRQTVRGNALHDMFGGLGGERCGT